MNDPDVCKVRVCAAILRPGDEVLIARESRLAVERINLPGGAPQPDETLERALIREVREETGYDVIPTEIAYVSERHNERWAPAALEICFYAEIVSSPLRTPQRGEHITSLEWMRLDDEELLREVPYASLFAARRRGRYIDEASSPPRRVT